MIRSGTPHKPGLGGLQILYASNIVIYSSEQGSCHFLTRHRATIGAKSKGVPAIGAHVDISDGAKTIDKVHIDDRANSDAEPVMRNDMPPYLDFVGPER